jgi:hypothetical protein
MSQTPLLISAQLSSSVLPVNVCHYVHASVATFSQKVNEGNIIIICITSWMQTLFLNGTEAKLCVGKGCYNVFISSVLTLFMYREALPLQRLTGNSCGPISWLCICVIASCKLRQHLMNQRPRVNYTTGVSLKL